VIKSSGHLIGPFEVESALMEHPAVAEAGVIGKPDPMAGESKRGKSVGTQVPHTPNANDQIGDRNKNIGAGAGQAGRSRALT
jgi:acetyl-CoA synthetase